jgi:hypothetical protein
MWLTLKIREDWTFLENPSEDSEGSEGDEESNDGNSDEAVDPTLMNRVAMTKALAAKRSPKRKLTRRTETPKCLRAKSYSRPARRAKSYPRPARRAKGVDEAKIGDKRVFLENKSDRTEVFFFLFMPRSFALTPN